MQMFAFNNWCLIFLRIKSFPLFALEIELACAY